MKKSANKKKQPKPEEDKVELESEVDKTLLYKILDIAPTASPTEIKKAYR
jgi:DnaJ-class molecular chaperone